MQSYYPERFERDMGTSEGEWLTALPRALGEHAYELTAGQARVHIGDGHLQLQWRILSPACDRTAAHAALGRVFCV